MTFAIQSIQFHYREMSSEIVDTEKEENEKKRTTLIYFKLGITVIKSFDMIKLL